MRRKEREVTDRSTLESIIKGTFYVSLALHTDNAPYQLPMNFGYENGVIYLHSATVGEKMNVLHAAGGAVPASALFVSKASLLARDTPSACGSGACGLSTRYASVVAAGTLSEVTDSEERLRGLRCLVVQAGGGDRPIDEANLQAIAVLKLEVATMTGKINDPAE